jgi:hypothetical protein
MELKMKSGTYEPTSPKTMVRKYKYFDVDFVDAETLAEQLNEAIEAIKLDHRMKDINDQSIKVSVDTLNKRLNLMYYDVAE